METLILIPPTAEFCDEIAAYREEFLQTGSSMVGCGTLLRRIENPNDWLKQVEIQSKKETVPADWVVSTQFIYVRESDRRIVGMIDVRHYFNEYLEKYGGNIGYSVRPSERRKGYAKRMLHDCLSYCREIGLEKVLITCYETNEASRRTILGAGGVYESTVFHPEKSVNLERYWIDLKESEKIKKLIGANMDIDFSNIDFGNSQCPWNVSENTNEHKCAVKNTSICKYFCGIQYLDSVLCSYPYENITVLKPEEMDREMRKKQD